MWPPHNLPDLGDYLQKPPPHGGRLLMWICGVGFAALPALYGLRCLLTGATTIIGRRGLLAVTGLPGVAFAVAFLSVGFWLHVHYFWSNHRKLSSYHELGKTASLAVLAGSLLLGAFGVLAFG